MAEFDYTAHYRKYHDTSERHVRRMEEYFRRSLRDFLPDDRRTPILEIGCGMGFALSMLKRLGFEDVKGIDIDEGQVHATRERGLQADIIADPGLERFSEANASRFGMIFAFDVVEHVPVQRQIDFIRSVRKLLRPGGYFVCQVPNALSPVASYQRYIDWTHHSSYVSDSLEFLLRSGGLEPSRLRSSVDPGAPGVGGTLIAAAKGLLRVVVRGGWRVVLLSEAGIGTAFRHPVSRNIIMLGTKPRDGS